jgi:chaperone required for assembly of F1-ATPase
MKRFYKDVATQQVPGGWGIALDGKTLRTPAKNALVLPTEALATAVAEEWRAQDGEIRPETMRLVRLTSTAVDRVGQTRLGVIDEVVRYAETDMLCYRVEAPAELVELQSRNWQPHLDWAALRFDAPLLVRASIIPVTQPPDSIRAIRAVLMTLDPLRLTAIADLTHSLGSVILALALLEGRIDAVEACAAAHLEEHFQNDRWGEDAEAMVRRHAVEADIHAAARFLGFLGAAE